MVEKNKSIAFFLNIAQMSPQVHKKVAQSLINTAGAFISLSAREPLYTREMIAPALHEKRVGLPVSEEP